MNSLLLKKALPHIIALVVFWIVSITVNKTALEDKILRQSDVQGFTGMAQQSIEFREKHGHFPLWTESMFGGMPGYNIAFEGTSAINIGYLNHLFYVGPKPIYFFLHRLRMFLYSDASIGIEFTYIITWFHRLCFCYL